MPAESTNGNGRQLSESAYSGAQDSTRRRRVSKQLWSEDLHLPKRKRQALTAGVRDQIRNFSVASWMVRKHLDYCTRFTFQAKTGDEEFNGQLERLIARRSTRYGCDSAARHSLPRLLRMIEARSVIDGDILVRRLAPANQLRRGRLQLMESELIDNTADTPKPRSDRAEWVNGVLVGDAGQALAYSVLRRDGRGTQFAGVVSAGEAYLHAFHEATHRIDQVRGTSAFAPAINSLRDVYEGFDWALLKVKIAQMFGLKITRIQDSDRGYSTTDGTDYSVDLSRGPFQLDMDPGDNAEFLESSHPAAETVEFLQLIIHIVLKALDLPYSFFREDFTNFFGSRAALLHYLRSAAAKIEALQSLLNWLTGWWFGLAIADGELLLPRSMQFEDLTWIWVPEGVPWWDPSKEISGNLQAVGACFDNVERICRATGTDFHENVRINAAAAKFAADAGFPLTLTPGVGTPVDTQDDPEKTEKPET